ncbi:MAG: tetratricopeptide repeat protein [Vampirovibrionales bacterium]|nr:tetratricopeptide repeat protein [Vampirovibrionales bacterium]
MSFDLLATTTNRCHRWLLLPWQGLSTYEHEWPLGTQWESLVYGWLQGLLALTSPINTIARYDASDRWQVSPYLASNERQQQWHQWADMVSARFVLSGSVFVDLDTDEVHLTLRLTDSTATDWEDADLANESLAWKVTDDVTHWPALEREWHGVAQRLISAWWIAVGTQFYDDAVPYTQCALTRSETALHSAQYGGFSPSLVHPDHVMRLSLGPAIGAHPYAYLRLCQPNRSVAEVTEDFQTLIAHDPTCQWAWWRWGKHMADTGHYAEAANAYSYLLQGSWPVPNRARLALALGHCQALQQKTQDALASWREALSLEPSLAPAALNQAHTLESLNRIEEAIEAFQHLAQQHPNDLRAYYGLARLYSRLQQWNDALTQYAAQSRLSPNDAWCLTNMATCHLQLEDIPKAVTCLQQAFTLDPDGEAGSLAQLVLAQLKDAPLA